jgi:hypothetical protein
MTTESLSIEKFTRISHPQYSPDITPDDFYLFGIIEKCLYGCQGKSFAELQENVQQILAAIPLEEILTILSEWKGMLQRIIIINREYV